MQAATRTRPPPKAAAKTPPIRPVAPRHLIPDVGPDTTIEGPSMAQAVDRLAAAVEAHTEMARPAHEVVAGFGERLDGLCKFLQKKGPWILGSVPGVLVLINAMSPSAAAALKAILTGLGAQ